MSHILPHLFKGTGFLGLGHGGWVQPAEMLGAALGSVFLGPEVGALLGVGDIAGGALVGAGLGGLEGAFTKGGNPLLGAVEGGLGGAAGAGLGELFGGGAAAASPSLGVSEAATTAGDTGWVDAASGSGSGSIGTAASTSAPFPGAPLVSDPYAVGGALKDAMPAVDAGTAGAGGLGGGVGNISNGVSAGFEGATSGAANYTPQFQSVLDNITAGSSSAPAIGVSSPALDSTASALAVPSGTGGWVNGIPPDAGAYTPSGTGGWVNGIPPDTSSAITAGHTAGATPPGSGGIASQIMKTLGIDKMNPMSTLASAGILAKNFLGNQTIPGANALKTEAGQLQTQGNQLSGYLASGTLPPGVQTSIDQATQAAKAKMRGSFASMGLSGSPMEASAMANIDQSASAQGAQIATQLLQTGMNETNMSAAIYDNLLKFNVGQNDQTMKAIASLASSMAGGGQNTGNSYSPEQVRQLLAANA